MGGGWLLGSYAAGWALLLILPFVRGTLLLVQGAQRTSAHLLAAAVILADAAVAPGGIPRLPAPLGACALLIVSSAVLRDTWLLVGARPERGIAVLEEICRVRGVEVARQEKGLVLKRLGTQVREVSLAPGLTLLRMDRRRREREVDRLGREWGRRLSRARKVP
jgi:hypothetical protein